MIPKKIHYIWLGGNPHSKLMDKCIASWKKFCPDYEIKEWNESNFDIQSVKYVKEACEAKKWAFASDYIRLYALYSEGGIYMDTDVEVLKPLDSFLSCKAFSGFESYDAIPTGIMACEQYNELYKQLLAYYDNRSFYLNNGEMDLTTNVTTITTLCLSKGLVLNNMYQNIEGFELYPKDYFCPKVCGVEDIETTENTYTIHHYASSWYPKKILRKRALLKFLGPNITKMFIAVKSIFKKR